MKRWKLTRILSALLALSLLLAAAPQLTLTAHAASGVCGENLTWSFDEASGTLTISGYGEMEDNYYVFTEYDDNGVFLGYSSNIPWFDYAAGITSVRLPDGLTAIGDCAFERCTALRDVTIPDSVTRIGSAAFAGCGSLQSITIPEKVTAIAEALFSDCTGLQRIQIPDGVTYIGWGAFSGCSSLRSLTVPEGVNIIQGRTFSDCGALQSVNIPEKVTDIGMEAFSGCSSLRSITIPEGVTSIGENAFFDCGSLQSVSLPESLEVIAPQAFAGTAIVSSPDNRDNGLVYLENWLITADDTVRNAGHVEVRPGTVGIASCVFEGCSRLTKATLPEGLKYIGFNVFCNCTALSELRLPDSIRCIDSDALTGTALYQDPNNWIDGLMYLDRWLIAADWEITDAMIRPGTVGIAGQAFRSDLLRSVTIPEGLRYIGGSAFSGCARLRRVNIPSSVESIGNCAFWGCGSLESISIPSGLTSINEGVFAFCESLTSLTIPDSVTRIGDSAFSWCRGLSHLVIPESVESIGEGALSGWVDHKATVLILNPNCAICDSSSTFEDSFPMTIAGHPGSTAEAHARKYGISFQNIEENPFLDVSEDAYYAAPVAWAVEQGVTNGTAPYFFSPETTCTRAQVVTFLWRAAGSPEPGAGSNPFADVAEGQYYCKAVLWAVEQGITNGVDTTHFAPDAGCTRGQVVTFLWRAAGKPEPESAAHPFADVKAGEYYEKPVIWAVENGVTNGTAADRFSPGATCTRVQIVTFLFRAA